MTTVRVEAPARLHMGMLDAAGDGPRRFGGLGVAVSRPAVVVEASASDELTVEGPDAERALAVAQRCRDALGLATGARVRVLEAIPAHAGLGSGTKLALAVTAALSALAGQSPDPAAMARTAGRGARSAVGLWTFALGGFVVEGGRRRGVDEPAPLLMRHAMPDEWRCVLVIPAAEPGLSGGPEEAAFADLRPDPARSARDRPARADRPAPRARRARPRRVRRGAEPAPAAGGRRVRARPGRDVPSAGRPARGCAAAARGGRRRPELVGPRRLRARRQRAAGARASRAGSRPSSAPAGESRSCASTTAARAWRSHEAAGERDRRRRGAAGRRRRRRHRRRQEPCRGVVGRPRPGSDRAGARRAPGGAAAQRRDRRPALPPGHRRARRARRGALGCGVRQARPLGRLHARRTPSRCCAPRGTRSTATRRSSPSPTPTPRACRAGRCRRRSWSRRRGRRA